MIKRFISFAAIAAIAFPMSAAKVTLWESPTPEGVEVGWGHIVEGVIVTPEQCADYVVGDKIEVTVVQYNNELEWPQILLKTPEDGWPNLTGGFVVKGMETPCVTWFEFDEEKIEWIKETGFFPSGDGCWISKMELVTEREIVTPPAKDENVLWESPTPEGVMVGWGHIVDGVIVTPEQCANYQVGDKIEVTVVQYNNELEWPQILLKTPEDGWPNLTGGFVVKGMETPCVTWFEFDEEKIEWIKETGFFPSGDGCWISKMVYVPVNQALVSDIFANEEPATVNVYNMQGMLIKNGVDRAEAQNGLTSGLYIIGGKKVLVNNNH